jgi:hypothetical protein
MRGGLSRGASQPGWLDRREVESFERRAIGPRKFERLPNEFRRGAAAVGIVTRVGYRPHARNPLAIGAERFGGWFARVPKSEIRKLPADQPAKFSKR